MLGTGGMSHQLQGERAGLINAPYDNQWLDDMVRDPLSLTRIGHTGTVARGGL